MMMMMMIRYDQFQSLPERTCAGLIGISPYRTVVTKCPIPYVKCIMNGMAKNDIPAVRKPATAWRGLAVDALVQVAWLSVSKARPAVNNTRTIRLVPLHK